MSEENEIKFPLYKDDLTRRGVLYQVVKEELPYAPDRDIENFIEKLRDKAPVNKEDVAEVLNDLEEQRGDYFMHTQCRKIAARLGVRFI